MVKDVGGGFHAACDELGNPKRLFRTKEEADALDAALKVAAQKDKKPAPAR